MKNSNNALGYKGVWLSHERKAERWVVEYMVGDKKKKKRFRLKADAVLWGKTYGKQLAQGQARSFTPQQEDKIKKCVALVGDLDILVSLAQKYASTPNHRTGATLDDSLHHWYQKVASREWQHKYWKDMGSALPRIREEFGDLDVGEVDAGSIHDWLLAIREESSHSYLNKHKVVLGKFFDWVVLQADMPCNVNPVKMLPRITKRVQDQPKKNFLTVEETQRLMDVIAQEDRASVSRFALGLFAGLRPTEICDEDSGTVNLPAECIDLDNRQIRITGEVAKRAGGVERPRIIEDIPETVWKYLEKYGKSIDAYAAQTRRRKLWEKAELNKPYQSILRHTYATHACPLMGMTRTAETMGHTGTNILNRHYKGLVDKRAAASYFELIPF